MGKYFVWNFEGFLCNSTEDILPVHWKRQLLYNIDILPAFRFKSRSAFIKMPPRDLAQNSSLITEMRA